MSSSAVIAHLEKSIATYANAANNTKGFISLEHDLTSETVNVAKSLIPKGKAHNLQIMSVADCLRDSSPYGVANNTAVVSPPINTIPPPAPAPVNSTAQGAGVGLDLGSHHSMAVTTVWSSAIVLGSTFVATGLALL